MKNTSGICARYFSTSVWLLVLFTLYIHVVPTYGLPVPTKDSPIDPPIDPYHVGLRNASGFIYLWKCSVCEIGMGLSVECGKIYKVGTKIECQPCQEGYTYSDKRDRGQCKSCTKCSDNELEIGKCTVDEDNIKCQCKVGYYKHILSKACIPCSWCCQDNSNDHIPECNVPQVPSKRQCSFHPDKLCGPTSTPTTAMGTSNIPNQRHSSITTTPAMITVINDYENATDLSKIKTNTVPQNTDDEEKPSVEHSNKSQGTDMHTYILAIVIATCALVLIVAIIACKCICRNSNSTRSSADPSDSSGSQNTDSRSSIPLLPVTVLADQVKVVHSQEPFNNASNGNVATNGTAVHTAAEHEVTQKVSLCKKLSDEDLSFICAQLGPRIVDLKHDIKHEVSLMLNVPEKGKDLPSYCIVSQLASYCNLEYYEEKNLQIKKENPMEDVFDLLISQTKTLESFINEIYKISRGDVVERLFEIARTK